MSRRVRILDIPIDVLDSSEVLERVEGFIGSRRPHQIITVNAEFLVASQHDGEFQAILKNGPLNTADGIGVLWAAKYLSLPQSASKLNWLRSAFQVLYSGLAVVFYPGYVRGVILEKISGVDLTYKLCEMAERKNHSVFFLGGFGDTPQKVAKRLKEKYPKLKVVGHYSGSPRESGLTEKLKAAKPDILLVAYGPVVQEKWIARNLEKLQIPAVMGVGGTFDYIAGKKPLAPQILRHMGLEWAFRLVTQPHRLLRVLQAVPVFVGYIARHKAILRRPYRRSIALVLKNQKGQILLCRREKSRTDGISNHWQLPRGGVEAGESDEQALRREMREELGLRDFKILGRAKGIHKYDWPLPFAKYYKNQFRGQEITVVYALANSAQELEIRPDRREFDACAWVSAAELLSRSHPVQRRLMEAVLKNSPGGFIAPGRVVRQAEKRK